VPVAEAVPAIGASLVEASQEKALRCGVNVRGAIGLQGANGELIGEGVVVPAHLVACGQPAGGCHRQSVGRRPAEAIRESPWSRSGVVEVAPLCPGHPGRSDHGGGETSCPAQGEAETVGPAVVECRLDLEGGAGGRGAQETDAGDELVDALVEHGDPDAIRGAAQLEVVSSLEHRRRRAAAGRVGPLPVVYCRQAVAGQADAVEGARNPLALPGGPAAVGGQ